MLQTELKKLQHSYIWIATLVLPLISVFMGSGNYYMNTELLKEKWYDLWVQVSLFFSYFFYPTMVALFAAYLCRLENVNNNWKSLLTAPISTFRLYCYKYCSIILLTILSLLFLFSLYIISGKFILRLDTPLPPELSTWFIGSIFAAFPLAAVQLFLSLLLKNFAIPIGISLLGGVSGLLFAAKGYGMFNPYSLTSIAVNADNMNPLSIAEYGQLLLSCFFFTILFSYACIYLFRKKCE